MSSFPPGWRSLRIGQLFRRRDERGRGDLPLLSVYREHGVVPREGREDNFNRPGENLDDYRVVHPGDLVLNKMKTWQGSLGVSAHKGIVSPAYFVAEQTGDADPRFLHHLLRSRPLIGEYGARSKGIRPSQWDLPWDEFKDIRIALPSKEAQRAIADLLDRKTSCIDALIACKLRMASSLLDRVASLRLRLLSGRALDYRNLRPTALPWLPEMPATWELRPLMAIAEIIAGQSPPDTTYNDVGFGAVLVNGPAEFSEQDFGLTRSLKWTTEPRKFAPKGALLFCLRGSTTGRLNTAHREVSIGRGVAAIVARGEQSYVDLIMEAMRPYILGTSQGSTYPSVTSDTLRHLLVPVPPQAEQKLLSDLMEAAATRVLSLRNALESQVRLLRNHRQALITSAVTGELDIPSVA